jgi:hypothetical protein
VRTRGETGPPPPFWEASFDGEEKAVLPATWWTRESERGVMRKEAGERGREQLPQIWIPKVFYEKSIDHFGL